MGNTVNPLSSLFEAGGGGGGGGGGLFNLAKRQWVIGHKSFV